MFNRKTLFVIGAGAGFDIDMPIGRALAEDIAKRTSVNLDHGYISKATMDEDLAVNFFERGDPKGNDYLQAFHLIRNGVLLANSIDDFLNIHEGSPEVVTVGKAAIVRSILHAERWCKLYVNPSNIYNKLDVANVRDTWFVKFMQVLGPGLKAKEVERVFGDVSFINFNYDRCLEYFLRHALRLMYGIDANTAESIVAGANIIHPYGSVGPLERVPFGGTEHGRMDYRNLSKSIKTYTERIEEPAVLENMSSAIREAQCIVFLGFAYHKQNMSLLKPAKSRPPLEIYGTAYGMSDSDVSHVIAEIGSFYRGVEFVPRTKPGIKDGKIQRPIQIENKLTCAQLFDYYAKSLAG